MGEKNIMNTKKQENIKIYPKYDLRVRECFSNAYRFFEKHKNARTAEDWRQIAEATGEYTDPLTIGLVVVLIEELEREYKNSQRKEES